MSHAFCSEEIKAQMEMKETSLKLNVHVFRDTEVQSEYETGWDGPSLLHSSGDFGVRWWSGAVNRHKDNWTPELG